MTATSVKYHHTPHAKRMSNIYANIRDFDEKSFERFWSILVSVREEFCEWVYYSSKWSIYITRATCGVGLSIVFVCSTRNKSIKFFSYLTSCSCTIPDKESIFTLDYEVTRVIYDFSIQEVIEIIPTSSCVYLTITIGNIVLSYSEIEIGKEISPGGCRHVDMNEVSLPIMEVYTILREDSLSDIATRDFFHIAWPREVPLLAIHIDREVRMPMYHIGTRCCNIDCTCSECDEEDTEKDFFEHSEIGELFDCLYHDFETADSEPYHSYQSRFEYPEEVEYDHSNTTEREQYCLADTCIHRIYWDISSVVDFFDKKYNRWQETRTREKHCTSHQIECYLSSLCWYRIHIKKKQRYRPDTRTTDDKQDEEVGLEGHDIWQKRQVGVDSR